MKKKWFGSENLWVGVLLILALVYFAFEIFCNAGFNGKLITRISFIFVMFVGIDYFYRYVKNKICNFLAEAQDLFFRFTGY